MDDCYFHPFETITQRYVYDAVLNRIYTANDAAYHLACESNQASRAMLREELDKPLRTSDLAKSPQSVPVLSMGFSQSKSSVIESVESGAKELILEITEDCCLRCEYCLYSGLYSNQRRHSNVSMPVSIAKQAIDCFLRQPEVTNVPKVIAFYGGEPLLAYRFIRECVDYASPPISKTSVRYGFTTNAILLTCEKFKFLRDHRFLVHVSLDGPPWIHDRHRKFADGRGSFHRVVENLSALRSFDESYYHDCIHFVCTVTNPAILPELSDFFEMSEFTRGQTVTASAVHRLDLTRDGMFDFDLEAYQNAMVQLRLRYVEAIVQGKKPNELERGLFDQFILRVHRRQPTPLVDQVPPNGACLPGTLRLFVRCDGALFPCERVGSGFSLGNVRTGVDSMRALQLVESYCRLSEPVCQGCWAVRFCSACYIHAQVNGELSMDRKRTNCLSIRRNLHEILTTYCSIMERSPEAMDRYLAMDAKTG